LARKYAPEVHLAPAGDDWTRPANVDWYLARVQMRFDHPGCPDCEILAVGSVTQSNMFSQSHTTKGTFCKHTDKRLYSKDSEKKFFLQPPNDDVHKGSSNPADWIVYTHVKSKIGGGYYIQYWFFYPYNDSVASVNHEADWEHITVTLNERGEPVSVYYAQHDVGTSVGWASIQPTGTHPIVYSADGSHASYPRAGSYDIPSTPFKDRAISGGPVWQTWNNLVNMGEKRFPLNGQTFVLYGGRWGEKGEMDVTSGPQGPPFQGSFYDENR